MFKNFWYAVCRSDSISQAPLKVQLADTSIVIFRDSQGALAALSAVCPHRGASLELGTVHGDCLSCSYHGWQFNALGECTAIPANQDGSAGKRFNTGYLPVQEHYGHVFVFVGDGVPELGYQLPEIPEFDNLKNWGVIFGQSVWQTHPSRSIENLLDFSHTAIVHKSFGNPKTPEVKPYGVVRTDTSASAIVDFCPPLNIVQWILRDGKLSRVTTSATFYMPNITRLDIWVGKWRMIVVVFHHQVSAHQTIMHWVQLRDFFTSPLLDWDARRRIEEVINEDEPIVESQRPFIVPTDLTQERHVPSDALHVAYRMLVRQFTESGLAFEGPISFRRR
ncbi:aromatic ring-hydroxylating dioxygenase subunit alpha [soil metagenome]